MLQEKRNKFIQSEKEEVNYVFSFRWHDCVKNKQQELINNFSKIEEYKISTPRLLVFLHTGATNQKLKS
jgi:hypothetical protein